MSSYPSQSNRQPELSNRFHHIEPAKPIYSDHHTTVNCDCCNRTMVPRVVSYYGQPLKSICPFCGTTFTKFQSGFQRFFQNFHTRTLSFTIFKRLAIAALSSGLLWLVSLFGNLHENLVVIAAIGTMIFGIMALAELIAQSVELLAARLSHESNYYWALIVVIAMITAHVRHELTDYSILFFGVMFTRWVIVGLANARNASS